MELKEILGELFTPEIEAKLEGKKFILDDGKMIPKHRFDEVNEQKKALQEQNEKYVSDFAEIKKQVKGEEELTKIISDMQKSSKELEGKLIGEMNNYKLNVKKDTFLRDLGVNDETSRTLLMPLFAECTMDEKGELLGATEIFESKIKSNPSLQPLITKVERVGTGYQQSNVNNQPMTLTESEKIKARDMNLDDDSFIELKQKFPNL